MVNSEGWVVNGELTVVDRIRKQESALEQAAEFTDAFNPLSFGEGRGEAIWAKL